MLFLRGLYFKLEVEEGLVHQVLGGSGGFLHASHDFDEAVLQLYFFKALGTPISGDSLKSALSKKEYDALTSAFRTYLGEQKEKYKTQFTTDKQRRDSVAQVCLDPIELKAHGFNEVKYKCFKTIFIFCNVI